MRTSVAVVMLLVGCSTSALAQSGSGGGGSSSSTSPSSGPRSPSAAPPGTSTPAPLQAPSTGASTPSQRNLDIAPPTRNLPESQGNAVTPQPPQKGAGPGLHLPKTIRFRLRRAEMLACNLAVPIPVKRARIAPAKTR